MSVCICWGEFSNMKPQRIATAWWPCITIDYQSISSHWGTFKGIGWNNKVRFLNKDVLSTSACIRFINADFSHLPSTCCWRSCTFLHISAAVAHVLATFMNKAATLSLLKNPAALLFRRCRRHASTTPEKQRKSDLSHGSGFLIVKLATYVIFNPLLSQWY